MAFGKGTWVNQDKILPGTYINFEGEEQVVDPFGVRGKAAMAMSLDWGVGDEIIKITPASFRAKSKELFGYVYTDDAVKPIREVFLGGARELYVYRLNGTGGTKATCDVADAVCAGTRGNNISILVEEIPGESGVWNVTTLLDGVKVDKQIGVKGTTVKDNAFVNFKGTPEFTAQTYTLSTGSNGTAATAATHTEFLQLIESYPINCVGLIEPTAGDTDVTTLYANWAIEQRDVYTNPVQAVLYNSPSDHEAVINVDDSVNLVAWFLGAEAGCEINASVQNKLYNGGYGITKTYTQVELEETIGDGKIVLQQVGNAYRVLEDINSLVTIGDTKNEDFKYNQTIRVMDQIAIDVSDIFNNGYIGKVANNDAGRSSFKNQVIVLLNEYVNRNVLAEYDTGEVTCVAGEQKGSLVLTMPVKLLDMLEKAYITVVVG